MEIWIAVAVLVPFMLTFAKPFAKASITRESAKAYHASVSRAAKKRRRRVKKTQGFDEVIARLERKHMEANKILGRPEQRFCHHTNQMVYTSHSLKSGPVR